MIRSQGPNCWTRLEAFNDRVVLKHNKRQRNRSSVVRTDNNTRARAYKSRSSIVLAHRSRRGFSIAPASRVLSAKYDNTDNTRTRI